MKMFTRLAAAFALLGAFTLLQAPAEARPSCTSDSQCDDGAFCNGQEYCRPGDSRANAMGCVAGSPPCSGGTTCDASHRVCRAVCVDADHDGYQSATCGGTDCDDDNPNRNPGRTEVCDIDGVDEDCDPETIAGPGRDGDADGDGYISARCWNRS